MLKINIVNTKEQHQVNLQHSVLPAASQSLALWLPCPHRAHIKMHFLCFRPARFQIGHGCHKGKNIPPSKLPLEQELPLFFCLQCPFFYQITWMICPKQALSLSGGHWGEGSPHSRLFCCYLGPHNPCRVHFATFLHLSPPMHLDLSPSYLWQPDGFGLPDKGEQAPSYLELSLGVKLYSSCCQARDLCPTDTPRAIEQELLPPSLGLQEGKRQILLARLK